TQNNNNNIINFYTLDFNKIDSYFTDNKISIGAIIISKDSKLLICEKYNSFVFFKIAWLITEKILYDKPNISNINIYINALLLSEKYIINKIKNKYNDLLNIFHSIIKNNTYIKNESILYQTISIFIDKIKILPLYNENDIYHIKSNINYFLISYYLYIENIKIQFKNSYKHLYVFPGGHKKKDEIVIDTLVREIYEETNIDLLKIKYNISKIYFIEIYDHIMRKTYPNILFILKLDDLIDPYIKTFESNEEIKSV